MLFHWFGWLTFLPIHGERRYGSLYFWVFPVAFSISFGIQMFVGLWSVVAWFEDWSCASFILLTLLNGLPLHWHDHAWLGGNGG